MFFVAFALKVKQHLLCATDKYSVTTTILQLLFVVLINKEDNVKIRMMKKTFETKKSNRISTLDTFKVI